MKENEIATVLVNIFLQVHKELGPGLLESIYEAAICYELDRTRYNYHRQKNINVRYKDSILEMGFRADIIVENKVIIEIKSLENLAPVHHKILLSYLKLTGLKLGLLVNFNVNLIKDGISRCVNNL